MTYAALVRKIKLLNQLALHAAATAALLFLGACYQAGYWLQFKINFLTFIDITDIIKYSVGCYFLCSIMVFSMLYGMNERSPVQPSSPVSNKIAVAIVALFIAAIIIPAIYLLIFGSQTVQSLVLLIALCFAVVEALVKSHFLDSYFKIAHQRYILSAVIFSILIAFIAGNLQALPVYSNESYTYISPEVVDEKTKLGKQPLKYIGKLSSYLFFISLDNKIHVIGTEQDFYPITLYFKEK